MRCLLIIFFLSLFPISMYGQSLDSLNHEIHLLELEMESINEKVDALVEFKMVLQQKIFAKQGEINQLEFQNQKGEGVLTKISSKGGKLRDAPSNNGNTIAKLNSGDEILLYDWYQAPYFKASYKGQIGYINFATLAENGFIKNVLLVEMKKEIPRLALLSKRYGESTAQRLIRKEIWKGMLAEMARDAIGSPNNINRKFYSSGVYEHWIYQNGKHLYFEDGVLTSWQD